MGSFLTTQSDLFVHTWHCVVVTSRTCARIPGLPVFLCVTGSGLGTRLPVHILYARHASSSIKVALVNGGIPLSAITCSPLWVKMVAYEEVACLTLTILLIKNAYLHGKSYYFWRFTWHCMWQRVSQVIYVVILRCVGIGKLGRIDPAAKINNEQSDSHTHVALFGQ